LQHIEGEFSEDGQESAPTEHGARRAKTTPYFFNLRMQCIGGEEKHIPVAEPPVRLRRDH
jgi:hypothetical protein